MLHKNGAIGPILYILCVPGWYSPPPPYVHFIGGKVVLFLRQVCPFLTIEYLSEMVENNHTGPFLAWAPRIYKYIWIRGPQGGPRGPRVSFDLYHPLLLHF